MSAVVVVHGGAWAIPNEMAKASVEGAKAAACRGFSLLSAGSSALDAVEVAVQDLEDNPVFNAVGRKNHLSKPFPSGHGAALNAAGEVELDAIIMDGRTLGCGAVSSVKNIAHPVSLARAVMEKTPHVLLTDRGANLFAERIGMKTVPASELVTEFERKQWEKQNSYVTEVQEDFKLQRAYDTVGAVAVDSAGNVACATSTGGIRNKMVGRVGDSPLIGCGGYADNLMGAVSCTGHGEAILKVMLARLILSHIEKGKSVAEASQVSLQYMEDRVKGAGGAIVVSPTGQWAAKFNTQRMAWAAVEQGVLWFGVDPNERNKEQVPKK